MTRRRFAVGDAVVVLVAILMAIWLIHPGLGIDILGLGGPRSSGDPMAGQDPQELLKELDDLDVRAGSQGKLPKYERREFGDGWQDLDGDGCDTRNEVLARDLDNTEYKPGTGNCVVLTGVIQDPYTDTTIDFQRGQDTSSLVQIDHVVALADAWESGAWDWSTPQRVQFSNDQLNLLAVQGQANQIKGAMTADEWLPDNEAYHCAYVSRQVAVKYKWDLSVTPAEADTMKEVLENCE